MDKEKIKEEMMNYRELLNTSPTFMCIYRNIDNERIKEKDIANFFALLCDTIRDKDNLLIKYMNKYGNID
ncbi:hypothetical protein [Clostridium botulinum]|uniref:Uncharacterized protein n=1 Tax=Clostridium botulinum CFSAN001627 TaxID=1232189 RepID=M1ZT57_CLOBO|nr:hypothetical protein [Clostridium botulinum]EKN42992.1 hypothetical protein CFSAN001627_03705 [Clostridium botulinum CFSAN001627]MBY6850371.1 hypothetical protein [Clostridium botulinum]MBY6857431.1 hypothetical protein [Clostridium botulinum]MBY6967401.1 hypothetical protein [Clostridium botulinum]HBJ1686149.1 hypothetical protein [Clostridium botulinum]